LGKKLKHSVEVKRALGGLGALVGPKIGGETLGGPFKGAFRRGGQPFQPFGEGYLEGGGPEFPRVLKNPHRGKNVSGGPPRRDFPLKVCSSFGARSLHFWGGDNIFWAHNQSRGEVFYFFTTHPRG